MGGCECLQTETGLLPKTQHVELITPLLDSLGQRRADAASLVAQEAQQDNGGPAQRQWV